MSEGETREPAGPPPAGDRPGWVDALGHCVLAKRKRADHAAEAVGWPARINKALDVLCAALQVKSLPPPPPSDVNPTP